MRAAARHGPPSPLLGAFPARPGGEAGPPVLLGPANPGFVPFGDLPQHVIRAITTSEDAGFFGHQGFDFPELLDALAAGAQAGRVVRGGSTITQQLAKNLYLPRDRTLARKAREAVLTVALEASVGKARLLEIYLNLIEWGPELYGIGPAARRYFGVEARALTPRQACFLAAVVPAPRRGWALVESGQAAEALRQRIDELLLKLNGYAVIDDETLQRELEAPLVFAFGATPTSAAPLAGGDAALEPDPEAAPAPDAELTRQGDAEPLAIPPVATPDPRP
jgi:membrane peptidoglycan carboxypeptidase